MRKIKFFIMTFVLIGIMFVLSGCGAYYSSCFNFTFRGDYMADKYIDLLIPLDENDEFYTPYNCNIEGDIEIPENSEIVNYNKDGYRSMLMHIRKSILEVSIHDSEYYSHKGTPYKIWQCVRVPYYEEYDNPYNEKMFLKFCNKYKKCYVAVFDGNGNILHISKKIPLVSLKNFYLQDILYDIEKNRIKPYYIMSYEIKTFIIEMWLLSVVGMIGCIITLRVYKINHNQWDRTYKRYIIASSIFNIPSALLIIAFIYCALGKSLTIEEFIFFIVIPVVNIGVLMHFIQLEKELRMKKYTEKNLDISENM